MPIELSREKKKFFTEKRLKMIGLAVLIVLVVFAIIYFLVLKQNVTAGTAGMFEQEYQAVFLSNGQVYFGKVGETQGDYLVMSDIYYLQAQNLQEGEAAAAKDMTLIKLGNEMHGPTDKMAINRSQILFIEDLKGDSQIVQAIHDHKQ